MKRDDMKPETNAIPGLALTERWFDLPLDYANPARKIRVFAREAVAPGKEKLDLPYAVFFQGGPGSGSPRSISSPKAPAPRPPPPSSASALMWQDGEWPRFYREQTSIASAWPGC